MCQHKNLQIVDDYAVCKKCHQIFDRHALYELYLKRYNLLKKGQIKDLDPKEVVRGR